MERREYRKGGGERGWGDGQGQERKRVGKLELWTSLAHRN